jgi:predicted extracellular nuclease
MTNLTNARVRFFNRTAVLTCAAALALSACANTSSGGTGSAADTATGGTDTSVTPKDTATGGDGATTGTDTSTAGTEKSIIDLQKASEACPNPDPQTWGEALGVTIREAVVTTPTKKQTSDGGLIGVFVQQKGGGQYSGIYVIASKTSEIGQVKPGDIITVTGDVKDYYCATQISNKFATIEAGTAEPTAVTVTTDDIGDIAGKAKTEPYEGVLVQLNNVVVGPEALGSDGKPHGDYYIGKTADDKALRMGSAFYGVYLSDKDGTTFTPKYPTGTKLGTVTGVLEYSFGTYRLVISKDPTGVVKP